MNFLKSEKNINTDALNYYFNYLSIPSPFSIYKNFNKLTPGSLISFNIQNLENQKLSNDLYYKKQIISNTTLSNKNYDNNKLYLENILTESINDMLIGDRPVGAFLSGGIDSSLICALISKKLNKKIQTFTIGFENKSYDESIFSKKISQTLGTDHNEHIFNDKNIYDIIPKIPLVYDEPFSDSSQIPTYLVSEIAKKKVTVALSGDGGDELFGGYNRYLLSNKYWPILNRTPYFLERF